MRLMGPAIIKSREIRDERFNGDRHERQPFPAIARSNIRHDQFTMTIRNQTQVST